MAQYAKKVDVHPLVDLTYNMYYKECIENKKNVPAFVGIAGQRSVTLMVARPEAV